MTTITSPDVLRQEQQETMDALWAVNLKLYPQAIRLTPMEAFRRWVDATPPHYEAHMAWWDQYHAPIYGRGLERGLAAGLEAERFNARYREQVLRGMVLTMQNPVGVFYELPAHQGGYRGYRYGFGLHEYQSGFGVA